MTRDEQIQFINDNYLKIPSKRIADILGRSDTFVREIRKKYDLVIPESIIQKFKRDSQFKKGNISFNKGKKQKDYMSKEAIERTKATRFKKGNEPHNTKYNGHERITKDGYIEIRIKKGKYILKHIHEWEKVNGKIPKGHCLWCLDGNKLNTNPDNWECITRTENLKRNVHYLPNELMRAKKLITRINKYHGQSKRA